MHSSFQLLVVSQSCDDTDEFVQTLLDAGYDLFFRIVCNADDFVRALKDQSWDLLLAYPATDKFGAADVLKQLKARNLAIPLVVISNEMEAEDMCQLMADGARDYVARQDMVRLIPVVEREMTTFDDRRKSRYTEYNLRQSETYFRTLIENTSDGIGILATDGTIRYESPSVEKMLGYTPEELIGKNVFDYIHPDDIRRVVISFVKGLKSLNSRTRKIHYRIRHKNGSWRTLETRGRYLEKDGEIDGIVVNYWDITDKAEADKDRKTALAQLRASEERYRSLFEGSRDAVFMSQLNGMFIDINPAGIEMLGYTSREELLATDIVGEIYLNSSDQKLMESELHDKGHLKDFELQLQHRQGFVLTVLVTAIADLNERNDLVGYHGIMRDITERKKLREQLARAQKLEAIGTLAGGIAHDFNNILAIILAFTELTRDEIEEGSEPDLYLNHIVNAIKRAKELIRQILTFSHQMDRTREPVQIHIVVEETLKMLRASIPSLIEVKQHIDKNCSGVLADPTQIHQVVMNLATNAYQAMREEGGVLEVNLDMVDNDTYLIEPPEILPKGKYLRITVRDTGHGMDAETKARIFDPFFTTKQLGEGSGMGLSVVHGIVKAHNGVITVNSHASVGSTFNVYLPQHEGAINADDASPVEVPLGKERVLLIDDNRELARVEGRVLERLGYQVTIDDSSVSALDRFNEDPAAWDLVITDQAMPKMTGVNLAREMMKIRPDIPVILLTGYSDIVTAEKAKSMGIREFVMKPVLSQELGITIRRVLDGISSSSNTEREMLID